jgi:hypothetical protein
VPCLNESIVGVLHERMASSSPYASRREAMLEIRRMNEALHATQFDVGHRNQGLRMHDKLRFKLSLVSLRPNYALLLVASLRSTKY